MVRWPSITIFKNRYFAASLDTLQCKHKLKIQWNFFATSHGKGPVDGIGGSVKHHVWGKVKARKAIVCDAATFAAAVKDMKGVTAAVLTQAEIKARNASLHLDHIFEAAQPIPGIARMHRIQSSKAGEMSTFLISADVGSQVQRESEEAQETPSIGDWYAVEYDGNMYPGEVIAVGQENDYQVSVMERAGKYWKWPNSCDVIFYLREKMSKKLDPPTIQIIVDTSNSQTHFNQLYSTVKMQVKMTWRVSRNRSSMCLCTVYLAHLNCTF